MDKIELKKYPDLNETYKFLNQPAAGAVNLFIGTVRNHTGERRVLTLQYEVYEEMADTELTTIIEEAHQRVPIIRSAVVHAIGEKQVGDIAVIIGVCTEHRDASFKATRYIIEELKKRVPIWKKEFFDNGKIWVGAQS